MSSDLDLIIKKKFHELLVELNEICSKKWQLLTNDGLARLNEISNLFTKLYEKEVDEDALTTSKFHDLQLVNAHFERLQKILDSFRGCIERFKLIETRLMAILDLDFMRETRNLIDKSYISRLVSAYSEEYELKQVLINEYLFKMRHSRQELVAITCYWMHEPHLDQTLVSQLKFLINYFK